jgi:hypothetical protein
MVTSMRWRGVVHQAPAEARPSYCTPDHVNRVPAKWAGGVREPGERHDVSGVHPIRSTQSLYGCAYHARKCALSPVALLWSEVAKEANVV